MGERRIKTERIASVALVAFDPALKMHVVGKTVRRDIQPIGSSRPEIRRTVAQDARVHVVRELSLVGGSSSTCMWETSRK